MPWNGSSNAGDQGHGTLSGRLSGARFTQFNGVCRGPQDYLDNLRRVGGHCGPGVDKVEGPSTHLSFLGIELDSQNLRVSLPQEKLCHLRTLLSKARGMKCIRGGGLSLDPPYAKEVLF